MIKTIWGYFILICFVVPSVCLGEFAFFVGGKSFRRSVRPQFAAFHLGRVQDPKTPPSRQQSQRKKQRRKPRTKRKNR